MSALLPLDRTSAGQNGFVTAQRAQERTFEEAFDALLLVNWPS